MTLRGDRLVAAAFLANAVLAGGNAVAIRFSNRELPPLWGAGLRFSLAAALLLILCLALRLSLPRGRVLRGALAYGALQFAGAFGLGYVALLEIHAGLGQILLALTPLATLALAVAQGQERLHPAAVAGALLGLAGIAVISRAPAEPVPLPSLLALFGSILCFAQAAILVRRMPPIHPVTLNTVGMIAGAALLLLGSALASEPRPLPARPETWIALGYVAVIGSVAVFLLYVFVLHHWSASRAAYVMVLIPFVTVALSARLDGEPVGGALVLGGLLVLTGVYIGALRPAHDPPPRPVSVALEARR